MKKLLLIVLLFLVGAGAVRAQDTTRVAPVDSTLVGKDLLSVMGPGVTVDQTPLVRQALQSYVLNN